MSSFHSSWTFCRSFPLHFSILSTLSTCLASLLPTWALRLCLVKVCPSPATWQVNPNFVPSCLVFCPRRLVSPLLPQLISSFWISLSFEEMLFLYPHFALCSMRRTFLHPHMRRLSPPGTRRLCVLLGRVAGSVL